MSRIAQIEKCVNPCINYITYEELSPVGYDTTSRDKYIIRSSGGSTVRRVRKLRNGLLSFSYYTEKFTIDFIEVVNTLNKNSIMIAGLDIKPQKALLLKVLPKPVKLHRKYNNSKYSDKNYVKVEVEIELEIQKSLLYTEFLDEDIYINSPITGKKVRLQFSSDPSYFLNDPEYSKTAFHIRNGFGFYSESRPDLNVLDPMPLDGSGNLLDINMPPVFHRAYDAVSSDWECLCFPKLCNVENNIDFTSILGGA